MPTPLGHALAGVAIAGLSGSGKRVPVSHIAVLVLCATAPDMDLLLRFVDGVNHHRGATHSLGAVALVAALAFVLRRLGVGLPPVPAIGAAWASHVLLDFLGLDTSPPAGEMALWPWSDAFYVSPVALFYDVRRSFSPSAIGHNAIAVVIELLILVPIVMFCWRGTTHRKSNS